MKHTKKTALTAAMLTAAVSMASAVTLTSCFPQTAYGPPDSGEPAVSVAEPTTYEPSTEEIQDVYGPPPAFEDEDEPIVTTKIEVLPEETMDANAAENTETTTKAVNMQVVYGPPNAIEE